MGSADPRVAAQARAQQRKKGKSKWGDTAFGGVEDVARAEEDFQPHGRAGWGECVSETVHWASGAGSAGGGEGGVLAVGRKECRAPSWAREEEQEAMEPFNLQQEREEGYFDAEGNYVEYREDTEATQRWAPPWPPRQQHDPSTHTHSSTSMEDGSDADDWEEPARHAANGAAEAIGNDSAEAASSASSRSSHSDAESEDRGAGDERREGNGEREEEKEGGYDGEGLDGDVKGSGVEESTGRDPQGDAREGGEQGGWRMGDGAGRAGEAAEGDERPAKRMDRWGGQVRAGQAGRRGGAAGARGGGPLQPARQPAAARARGESHHPPEEAQQLDQVRAHPPPTHPARGARVLDLACGKGGDLTKWARVNVGFYLGVDVAEGSVHDAMARYNGDSHRSFAGGDGADSDRRQMRFPAKLACADCFGVALDRELLPWAPFDICSTQFALHYSFETEQRARCGLRNIAALLRPAGGMFIGTIPDANVLVQKLRASPNLRFGNSVYSIEFAPEFADKKFPSTRPYGIRYEFRLEDAVDCPEWLVPFAFLQRLAGEYGLQALYHANFHTFIKTHAAVEPHASLLRRIAGERWREEMTADEWDAAYLYCVFVFRKEGQGGPEGGGAAGERREEVIRRMESDDILIL
ncbi:unnamed protein product [Closterium sp. Yama58-4]|nr:unnamed protein product [Closterium sp. Yama58-4]